MTTIASLSAAELGPLYASRDLSPVEVARDALERIERFEPQINAFVVRDAEVALAMAEAAQARWLKGEPLGPLDGVPVTLKENIATDDSLATTAGAIALADSPASHDAYLVRQLRDWFAVDGSVEVGGEVGGLGRGGHRSVSLVRSSSGASSAISASRSACNPSIFTCITRLISDDARPANCPL